MVVELISVGTEILLGNIVNTNAAFLAERVAMLGLSLYYQTSVGDNEERLAETIITALSRSDIVLLSGGLGPTKDDLTKEVAAKVMNRKLVEDPHSKSMIERYFKDIQAKKITDNNWKQAMIPEGAIVLDNSNGTAPGIIIEENNKAVILLPGPPNELIPLFNEQVAPYLKKLEPDVIYSEMVKLCGVGESAVETAITDMIDSQSNPTIAPYAKTGEVHLRVTAKARDEEEAKRLIAPIVAELDNRFHKHIYTTDESMTFEDHIVSILKKNNYTISTAESCTGGMLSARLINVSGVSEVFKQGFITYSNEAKMQQLNVQKTTLDQSGAVSHETAYEMALGVAGATGCSTALSITGIAGPEGGTLEKPVGLVYIGCCINGKVTVKECHFHGNREKIREYAVINALVLLRDCILVDTLV